MLRPVMKSLASPGTTPTLGSPLYSDWDTVFGITYDKASEAIAAKWSPITANSTQKSQAGPFTLQYTLNITFGPWQVTMGGDGKNVDLLCPIESGTLQVDVLDSNYPSTTYNFASSGASQTTIGIEVGLEWIPDPSQTFVSIPSADVKTIKSALINGQIPTQLVQDLQAQHINLSPHAVVTPLVASQPTVAWQIIDGANSYGIFYSNDKSGNEYLNVYQFADKWQGQLQVQKSEIDGAPPVTIRTIKNSPVTSQGDDAIFSSMVTEWFNENIGIFNHVFAALDITTVLAQNNQWKWITPTSTGYAVLDGAQPSDSTFGVLTMAGGNPSPDTQSVPSGIIPSDGSDAAFLISGKQFMTQMMLPGVMAIFDSTNESDFVLTNEKLQWTNANDLTWGPFILSDTPTKSFVNNTDPNSLVTCYISGVVKSLDTNTTAGQVEIYYGTTSTPMLSDQLSILPTSPVTVKSQGTEWYVVDSSNANNQFALKLENGQINIYSATQLHIPAKQFTITVDIAQLSVSFVNLTYSANQDYNVSINYNESWTLGLKEVSGTDAQGNSYTKQVFWYTGIGNKGLAVSVTQTQAAITRDIVLGAVSGAIALITSVGAVAEGLYNAAQIGEITEEAGDATIGADAFAQFENDPANQPDLDQEEEEAATEAVNQSTGKWANIKAAFKTPKWKAMGALSTLVGLAGGADHLATDIITSAAQNQWENVPDFNNFSNLCIAPYTFPNLGGFALNSAQLNGGLQIGLKVNP